MKTFFTPLLHNHHHQQQTTLQFICDMKKEEVYHRVHSLLTFMISLFLSGQKNNNAFFSCSVHWFPFHLLTLTQKQHNGNGEPNSFMDNVYSSYVKNNELVFYFLFFSCFLLSRNQHLPLTRVLLLTLCKCSRIMRTKKPKVWWLLYTSPHQKYSICLIVSYFFKMGR